MTVRRGCASPTGCDDSVANGGAGCHLCDVVAHLPERPLKCGRPIGKDLLCELVEGHPSWVACRNASTQKKAENETRDGDPKLAAERKRGNLAFQKRNRQGPNYVPSNARV